MKVLQIPDDMGQFDGHREGVNVFASEIDAQGRRVVSVLALNDFPTLFEGVTVTEVEYEPMEIDEDLERLTSNENNDNG